MSDLDIYSSTQQIIVDPFTQAVSTILAGPAGPPGPPGDGEVLWSDIAADALATEAEALAGIDDTKAISPYTLNYVLDAAPNFARNERPLSFFGVTPSDTAADVSAAFADAVTYLNNRDGGAIFVDGRYEHEGITVSGVNNIHITGAGWSASRLALATDSPTADHVSFIDAAYCGIRDVQIAGLAGELGRDGLVVHGCGRFTLARVAIQSVGRRGLSLAASSTPNPTHMEKITDLIILNSGERGIHQTSGYDGQFTNIWIGQPGAVTSGSTGWYLATGAVRCVNLHIWGGSGHGLNMVAGAELCQFSNLYLEHQDDSGMAGLRLFGASRNTFDKLDLWANANGLSITGTSDHNSFSNLIARNNLSTGVTVANGLANKFVNVYCYDDQETKTQVRGFDISNSAATSTMITNLYSATADHTTAGYRDSGTDTRIDTNSIAETA